MIFIPSKRNALKFKYYFIYDMSKEKNSNNFSYKSENHQKGHQPSQL